MDVKSELQSQNQFGLSKSLNFLPYAESKRLHFIRNNGCYSERVYVFVFMLVLYQVTLKKILTYDQNRRKSFFFTSKFLNPLKIE